MKLFKISATTGRVSTVEISNKNVMDQMKQIFGTWAEMVGFPIVFEGNGQLIGLLSEIGAIDPTTTPNTLATQFYRVNGELASVLTGNPVMLWGDVYFGTFDYNDPEADIQPLPSHYDEEHFLNLIPKLALTTERFLMV